jgi:hypothetical protein
MLIVFTLQCYTVLLCRRSFFNWKPLNYVLMMEGAVVIVVLSTVCKGILVVTE